MKTLIRAALAAVAVLALHGIAHADDVTVPAFERLIQEHPVTNEYPKGIPAGEIQGTADGKPCWLRVAKFPAGFEETVPDPNLFAQNGNHSGMVLVGKRGYRITLSLCQDEYHRMEFYDLVTTRARPYAEGGEGNSMFADTQWAKTEPRDGGVLVTRSHYGLLPQALPIGWETQLDIKTDAAGNVTAVTGTYVSKMRGKVRLQVNATFATAAEGRRVANFEKLHQP